MVVQSTKITLKQIQMRAGIKVRVPEQPQGFRAPGQSYKGSGRDGNVGAQRSPSRSGDQAEQLQGKQSWQGVNDKTV